MRRVQSAQSIQTTRFSHFAHGHQSINRLPSSIGSFSIKTGLRSPVESHELVTSSVPPAPSLPIPPASISTEVIARVQELSAGGQPAEPHFGIKGLERLAGLIADQWHEIANNVGLRYEVNLPQEIPSLSDLQSSFESTLTTLASSLPPLPSFPSSLPDVQEAVTSQVTSSGSRLMLSAESASAAAWAVMRHELEVFSNSGGAHDGTGGSHDLLILAIVTPAVIAAIAASLPSESGLIKGGGYPQDNGPDENDPDDQLSTVYSPSEVAAYFKKRPLKVAARAAQVAAEMAAFGAVLSLDFATGNVDKNEAARADQLRGVIERLGPAFIKIAQALSTRGDLLSPEYFKQIASLQDRVPPFSNVEAFEEMTRALGRPPSEIFESISDQPIAAASLGQVYRATLRPEMGGTEVAIKVQRPRVLEQVALDLYLMREAAVKIKENNDLKPIDPMNKSGGKGGPDWPAIIDEWAGRFFSEMDFSKEARNAKLLSQQMSSLEGIVIADMKDDLTSRTVLVSQWIYGEKLGESSASDVRELCTTLLNAYLIQLLETGFLHADPHPGNLIRTPDGKICILDYGLMTEINAEQRWALLEYIAHLSSEDWPALAKDLQVLGFIPLNIDIDKETGLVQQLSVILKQLVGGGGAAKINIDKVTVELDDLGKNYPFSIPPFFSLILRAFSVIEGIALGVDKDYSIVQECFPYLSKRLLSDDSPRAKQVLRDLIYGSGSSLDVKRIERVAAGFGAFTVNGVSDSSSRALAVPSASRSSPESTSTVPLDPRLREVLVTVLGRRGTYVQEVLVQEAVKAVDALSRETLTILLRALLGNNAASLASSSLLAFRAPWKAFLPTPAQALLPPTPSEVLSRLSNALELSAEDRESLGLIIVVLRLLQQQRNSGGVPATATSESNGLIAQIDMTSPSSLAYLSSTVEILPEIRPGLTWMAENFTRSLLQRALQRASLLVRS